VDGPDRHGGLGLQFPARKEGVGNAITAVPDTFQGRVVKDIATGKIRRSLGPGKSHGPLKMSSKAVVALLPLTVEFSTFTVLSRA
jgi:hypothetical protein